MYQIYASINIEPINLSNFVYIFPSKHKISKWRPIYFAEFIFGTSLARTTFANTFQTKVTVDTVDTVNSQGD